MPPAPAQRPEGSSPANDNESRAGVVIAIATVFASLSTLLTCVRVYTRARILRIFCRDDVAIICAQLLAITASVITGIETKYGLGRHIWVLDPADTPTQLKLLYAVLLCYNVGMNVVKIGFLLFYLRIFSSTALKTVVSWVLGYVLLWTVTQVIILTLACMPLSHFMPGMEGRCLPTYPVWLASSVVSAVTDFVIFALPLPWVLKLKLPTKQKIITVFMFSLGFFTCIVSIVRILTLKAAVSDRDPTWDNVGPGSWSIVELNCAILCHNLPTLRPLIVRFFPTFALSPGHKRHGHSGPPTTAKSSSTRGGSPRFGDVESQDREIMDNKRSVARCFSSRENRIGDDVELVENKNGMGRILVTTDTEVVSDEAPPMTNRRPSWSWDDRMLEWRGPHGYERAWTSWR